MKTKKSRLYIFAAPLITLLIMIVIYAVKGIYPFGSGNIQGGDLYQLYLPNFFHTIDAFKGGSPVFDFTAGAGAARNELMSLASPTSWFVLLFSKEKLTDAVSLLIIIKLVVISLCASYAFSKIFPKLTGEKITLLSMIYTFCGYDVQYYTNINWLDVVALYPLLIMALLNMFKGKSKLPFIMVMTYLLAVQTYMAFFIVVSLVLFGGVYIFFAAEKESRKKNVYSLGAGTLISIIASSYQIYCFVFGSVSSARFNYNMSKAISSPLDNYLSIISTIGYKTINDALFMFIGAELAFACLILLVLYSIKKKEHRGYAVFFALTGIMLAMQAYCLATDLMWHGGSRLMFPFRNGYMVGMWATLVIGYFLTRVLPDLEKTLKKREWLVYGSSFMFIAFAVLAVAYSKRYIKSIKDYYDVVLPAAEPKKLYVPFIILIAFVTLGLTAALVSRFNKVKTAVIFVSVFALMATNAYTFIGNEEGSARAELYSGYFSDCFEVKGGLGNNDEFQRVKNPDTSLISNYSYFADTASVSNWVNSLKYEQIDSFKKLGFSTTYTRTLDSGSTAFADSLLSITNSVSKAELNPSLYEKTGETKSGIGIYKNRFTLPVGLLFDNELKQIEFEHYGNTFDYQNAIYKSLTGDSGLFTLAEPQLIDAESLPKAEYYELNNLHSSNTEGVVNTYTFTLNAPENSTLYFRFDNEDSMFYSLSINGNRIKVYKNAEGYNRDNNYRFPQEFNNNVLELGSYSGELEISLDMTDGTLDNAVFSFMDNSKLEGLCASLGKNSYSVSGSEVKLEAKAKSDGLMFIPLSYSENWRCTVNGEAVEPIKVLGNFVALQVKGGKNSIALKFTDKKAYFRFTAVFLAFGVAAALAYFERKIKSRPDWLLNLLFPAFELLFGIAVIIIYALPLFRKFLH